MNKKEAFEVLQQIMIGSEHETWRDRCTRIQNSEYPGLLPLYEQWLNGTEYNIKPFHDRAMEHIMTANTKLYKALK